MPATNDVASTNARPRSINSAVDLQERWVPSPEQTAAAAAVFATVPAAQRFDYCAFAPLALPGKSYSIWTTGQPVEPVPGLWLARREGRSGPLAYRTQRDAAATAARDWLTAHNQTGTVATVVFCADGWWAVFEDFADLPAQSHRVDVLVIRDPDADTDVSVYLDGQPASAACVTVDPGKGWTTKGWAAAKAEAVRSAHPELAQAVSDAYDSYSHSEWIT